MLTLALSILLKNEGGTNMIEVAYLREMDRLDTLPKEVQETIMSILLILDSEYGSERRKYEDLGGYVAIVEKNEDLQELKDRANIDCDNIIAEYTDRIICSSGKVYTNSLILLNNDFGISIIMPLELIPENLKSYMID
jgi:hypothetical protein